jgi:hypothetical protein
MNIDERLQNISSNMELLQGMMRDLITKVDTLVETSAKHDEERAKQGEQINDLRARLLRGAAGLLGMDGGQQQ